MSLGERLKQLRESRKISQTKMAKVIGTNPQTWRIYEGDKSVPGGNVLEALARMGFNVNWILTGEGEMKRAIKLSESEAHQALKERLRNLISPPSHVMGFGMAWDTYRAYVYGDYLPTTEELEVLCKIAGWWNFETGEIATRHEEAEKEISKQIEKIAIDHKTSSKINIDLLKEVVTEIEEALFKSAIKLEPNKKAELLAIVYDEAAESEERRALLKERVKRLLRLVG